VLELAAACIAGHAPLSVVDVWLAERVIRYLASNEPTGLDSAAWLEIERELLVDASPIPTSEPDLRS
jgi:hypothetical protein